MHASLTPLNELDQLSQAWREMEESSDLSFFVSWSWISAWLQLARSNGIDLYLYRCHQEEQTIALAIFSHVRVKRRHLFKYDVLALHEIPVRNLDMIIEYNSLLIRRGYEAEIYQRVMSDLLAIAPRWDEVRFSGISVNAWNQITGSLDGMEARIEEQRTPWVTDISTLDGDLDKLLAPMSRNRRWQIRRSFKAFESEGALKISLPATINESYAFFEEMEKLHTARWNSVGNPGSFSNVSWVQFHRDVIQEGFNRNEIQLLRVSVDELPIGYIYSFVWRGTVYMLQSGFSQEDDNVKRTGYVSHCLAMQFNSASKHDYYDFMCGNSEYKRVLANEIPPLIWGAVQRKNLQWRLEESLLYAVRKLRQLIRPTTP